MKIGESDVNGVTLRSRRQDLRVPVVPCRRRNGAVRLLVVAALVVGILLGVGGYKFFGGGGGVGGGGGKDVVDPQPPTPPPPPTPPSSSEELRVTQAGVEWNGRVIAFSGFEAIAREIAAASEDRRIRVIYAADVDHLSEQEIHNVLKKAGLTEVVIHEKR